VVELTDEELANHINQQLGDYVAGSQMQYTGREFHRRLN
jgi:hypothetical protein